MPLEPMSPEVAASYAYCQEVAKTRARNFYYSFLLLSKTQRAAMCAIYAFMRYCDDLSDDAKPEDEAAVAASLAQWRNELEEALVGRFSGHAVWPAFHDTVERFHIPHQYFRDMIEGVSSDLDRKRIATFDELYRYCYQVASVVGLTIIHIFGFQSRNALALAEACGIAFQLTNILRDVKEDADLGRVYLPADELAEYGIAAGELSGPAEPARFREMMRFQAERARAYYRQSRPLVGLVDRNSRSSLWALIEIYSRLLERIEASGFDVLRRRIRLPNWEKVWILIQARLRPQPATQLAME